ncbi:hypothetical protein COCSUDRAFT_32457 [Coccomyxa subellipsoidea C-169]|uniref:Uncharacterized protein n=1 Tax=Coccomyxa subellipsoidea (strain C-169) TaxID=574566 RepID=I0Z5T9_COCSC|nr:hypothetical protein COCSUDRAFT_32457 [Coccomyxa subellipsoidea C-169]EIE26008.1 hypothetical protein COCSUDRAFT_32457 [Coccomyxa subellipsoidea C-169]|eukprot:XP_005650552.1 hypothetical protein COCSUDRAFT_32457 [Coccomyxa subellipsoidea C-169]
MSNKVLILRNRPVLPTPKERQFPFSQNCRIACDRTMRQRHLAVFIQSLPLLPISFG